MIAPVVRPRRATPRAGLCALSLLFLIATNPINACASGLKDLEKFLSETRSGSASFVQTVTAPARAGEPTPKPKVSSGQFEFLRPDRFRFEYRRPFEQTIVADGKTLWLYDADLNQVTRRPQAQALGSAPAALVASTANMARLAQVFALSDEPDAEGLSWVQAVPRQAEGQLKRVRMGFASGRLVALDMEDAFGQVSRIRFEGFRTQTPLTPQQFVFKVPPGADLVEP